jgi:hypothetical protein
MNFSILLLFTDISGCHIVISLVISNRCLFIYQNYVTVKEDAPVDTDLFMLYQTLYSLPAKISR